MFNLRRLMRWIVALATGILALSAFQAAAHTLTLGAPFSEHMVIQRDQVIPIWGEAEPDARVEIELVDQKASTIADKQGNWHAILEPMGAHDSGVLTITTGDEHISLADVALGDVFLCSGQSNMEFSMAQTALNDNERRTGIDARLRLLKIEHDSAQVPRKAFASRTNWRPGTTDSASFSSICLLFGRAIARDQGVIVGLVNSSFGGTPIESWMNRTAMIRAGGMEERVAMLDAYLDDPELADRRYGEELGNYWKRVNSPFRARMGFANLYNAMIAPLGRTRFAGVLWYQGENNANGGDARSAYRSKLDGLVVGWREQFGEDLPFIIFQLSSFGPLAKGPGPDSWAEIREAQRQVARDDPRVGLVVSIDVGERLDIHPPLKKPVAQRAALVAKRMIYGQDGISTGPQPVSARWQDEDIVLEFADVDGALFAASWQRPGPFQLCEAGGEVCSYADARFWENRIRIVVPEGIKPELVRYCWAAAPICNIFDQKQLPLVPFELGIGNDGAIGAGNSDKR